MYPRFILGLILSIVCTDLRAAEPPELAAAKEKFAAIPHPSEADRRNYLAGLAKLRESMVKQPGNEDWFAVDAEMRRHPAPDDTEGYTRLMVGEWSSPRHEYIYRADGTWCMLPEEEGNTRGRWRIEGNRYWNNAEMDGSPACTILLLTKEDFIFTDGKIVFYEKRIR